MADSVKALPAEIAVPRPELSRQIYGWIIWGSLALILAWSFFPAEMDRLPELVAGAGNMAELMGDFAEPKFRYWETYARLMLETVQMAVWGSLFAVILAVPLGLLSSSNLAPAWVTFPVRRLMDAFRAINELVFALIFVAAVGLGPLAGVLALVVHTTGVLAKLFSEAVEAIDPRPVEGIRATGASQIQEIVYGVGPQVLPLWISISLYRFESNIRSASVLGFVGAGGIGMSLYDTMRSFDYGAVAGILLILIVVVSIFDILSQFLRKVVIDGADHGPFVAYLAAVAVLILTIELHLADLIDLNVYLRGR
ncbi:MAG: phosphonate ABC transporter, permease protein PhnE [Paracoccaceae bacterium]